MRETETERGEGEGEGRVSSSQWTDCSGVTADHCNAVELLSPFEGPELDGWLKKHDADVAVVQKTKLCKMVRCE